MTWHGFQSMASTRLNEATEDGQKLWEADWIERQLAHVDGSVRVDYNAAEYRSDRRRMTQWWQTIWTDCGLPLDPLKTVALCSVMITG